MFRSVSGRPLLAAFVITLVGASLGACGGGDHKSKNQPPTAAFTATPEAGLLPLSVSVDAHGSTDPEGVISSYVWDFGDSSASASGVSAAHDYLAVGAYTITLTVTDRKGRTDTATRDVVVMSDAAAEWYSVTEITSLGGWYTEPRRINNRGEVTGVSYVDDSETGHAFLYSAGATKDLGTLGGAESWGAALNAAGDVVGTSETAASDERAFLYHGGSMKDLGTLGGSDSEANAISDAGQVVGRATTEAGYVRAFIYENGAMRSLGTLGGDFSVAADINSKGQVAGSSNTAANEEHLFIYEDGAMTDVGGGSSGSGVWARAINASRDVVGMWVPPQGYAGYTGFLYRNGTLSTLAAGYSEPADVNDAGVVVGSAHFGNEGHAFVWDASHGLQDLNALIDPSLGLTLQVAQGINDLGQIAGHGYRNSDGKNVAFRLTPTTKPAP